MRGHDSAHYDKWGIAKHGVGPRLSGDMQSRADLMDLVCARHNRVSGLDESARRAIDTLPNRN
jgi:hypothetical protein